MIDGAVSGDAGEGTQMTKGWRAGSKAQNVKRETIVTHLERRLVGGQL
jgi:hypothetical protein